MRYADAAYFYRHDTGRSLESYTPRLGTLTFHAKLGSMLDRIERLKQLAPSWQACWGPRRKRWKSPGERPS